MTTRRGFLAGGAAAIIAGAAPRTAWASTEADVCIIGAGLAGLSAARLLEEAGARVAVIEGNDRIGGRLHTLRSLPGAPEAGGIQVGAGYTRLRAIAAELGVGLEEGDGAGAGAGQRPGNLYAIGGTSVPEDEWAGSPANPLTGAERAIPPAALARYYSKGLPDLGSPRGWLDAAGALDIPLRQAFRAAGASDAALRLIEANFNGNTLEEMSQLHLARTLAIFRSQPGPVATIRGDAQSLPEAMAASLKGDVERGNAMVAMAEEEDAVRVSTARRSITARHVICTAPFAALRDRSITGEASKRMSALIRWLPYTQASFLYIRARSAFWREDGLPETLWSDDPMIGRVFVLGDDPPMLKLWTTGAGAAMLDRMERATAARMIVEKIEAARPSARGQLVPLQFFSWRDEAGARGIYHHIGTGMAGALADAVRGVAQGERGRLHFAGEHLAVASSGMEGAIESGEQAARRAIERIG